jgi:hypothetical protein
MIASDRDGAITRTDEPGRSFGGTTGIGPSCLVPPGSAIALPARLQAAGQTGGKPNAGTRAGSPNEMMRVIPAAVMVSVTTP